MQTKQSKIVVDTNLWISYLITKGFKRLDKLIDSDKVRLVFSHELIDEFIIKEFGKTKILTITDFELLS